MTLQAVSSEENPFDAFDREIEAEYEQASRTRKEIEMMIQQSQLDMNKLATASATRAAQLQQVQAQIETMPRADIKNAYNSAMDAQQRLLVTRGQVEKLQNDVDAWGRYIGLIERVREYLAQGGRPGNKIGRGAGSSSGSAMLEMVIDAQENEREALSKRMHDGPAQALSNFIVQAEIASRFLDSDAARAKDEMTALKTSAMSTFRDIRAFIFDLRPMMLDDLGPIPTIQRYIDGKKEQSGCEITLAIKGSQEHLKFPKFQAAMLFRAIQELVENAIRHNQDQLGKLQIGVTIILEEDSIRVNVTDNGKGFDEDAAMSGKGLGLKLIRQRVELIGGSLDIDTAIGHGARISFQVPILEDEHE